MADVVLKNLRKEFEGGVVAVDSVNLSVEDGEFLVLRGDGQAILLDRVDVIRPGVYQRYVSPGPGQIAANDASDGPCADNGYSFEHFCFSFLLLIESADYAAIQGRPKVLHRPP